MKRRTLSSLEAYMNNMRRNDYFGEITYGYNLLHHNSQEINKIDLEEEREKEGKGEEEDVKAPDVWI